VSLPRPTGMPRDRWEALVRGEGCPACAEVTGPGRDTSEGYFVTDLCVSRLRLQREQHVPGWCVLLLRRHVREPHELPEAERSAFFEDMVRVGHALEQVYAALKINYSILGNIVPHLHAHSQPRFYGDPYPGGPVSPAPGQAVVLPAGEAREQILRIRAALGTAGPANSAMRYQPDE
jgi:diadenosine tetraphosphate (Ap4A) HIT family hydrolase